MKAILYLIACFFANNKAASA